MYRNKEAFEIGLIIGDLITRFWNMQESPRKVHVLNRRVHHGEVGSLLGLLSGLGEGLTRDDYDDKEEWFTYKKRRRPLIAHRVVSDSAQNKSPSTRHSHHESVLDGEP